MEGRNLWFSGVLDLMKTTSCSGHIIPQFCKSFPLLIPVVFLAMLFKRVF